MFDDSSDDDNDVKVEISPSMALLLSREMPSDVDGSQKSYRRIRSSGSLSRKPLKKTSSFRQQTKKRRRLEDDDECDHSATECDAEMAVLPPVTISDVSAFYMSIAEVDELEEFKQAKASYTFWPETFGILDFACKTSVVAFSGFASKTLVCYDNRTKKP